MMGLSDGERISMIRSSVLIQYTRVTDGRTDRRNWRGIYAPYHAVERNDTISTRDPSGPLSQPKYPVIKRIVKFCPGYLCSSDIPSLSVTKF